MQKPLDFGPYTLGIEIARTPATRTFRASRNDGVGLFITCIAASLEEKPADPEDKAAFERAVRLLFEMPRPELATIVDSGISSTVGWFAAIEEPHGKRLDTLLAERVRIDAHAAHAMARQAAGALGALGEAGLVHGHLRPSSFVVRGEGADSTVVLTELPIVSSRLARNGEASGTLEELYLSPEHVSGGPLDERTDVHSLGLIFLELLVGTERFENVRGSMLMAARPFAPEDGLSSAWNRLLARALGRDPRTRHESVRELCDELETLHSRSSSGAIRLDVPNARSSSPASGTPRVPAAAEPYRFAPTRAAARAPAPAPAPTAAPNHEASSAAPLNEASFELGAQASTASPLDALELDTSTADPPPSQSSSAASPGSGPSLPSEEPKQTMLEDAPEPAPPSQEPAKQKSRLELAKPNIQAAAQAATQFAGRATERATEMATTGMKKNRTGVALGGIVLAVGLVAAIFFALVRLFDDGSDSSSGPPVQGTKHTVEGNGATTGH
jgi:serine/threonine protein kinase